ncbi:hypothetical protein HBI56_076270 [Parastagonospora nodorum]|uniref:Uncharacterized protein n=1 Tax=Phaeosphaeria nodorum (strain SN15 / ATCC MYA-4574 / FGSC 10173) TaxID=321614 RepID=A0A7U2HXH1_PHANO|nr:hypothetical protein HBH56_150890 [Parastagonospora nodorum]QRC94303.1 hypothetical protein JI435_405580 [Parastagonospora nodorum SN15]KAH3928629.1 hypothetical protein HBH54_136790 [Parastagonospora nodorum]KAH3946066.1 hypothetical protein HBH53_138350 [Parastagonospora nodorum]KAH3983589.1 hypothetical protein HBH52_061600 [Parastagonospora nodorum]
MSQFVVSIPSGGSNSATNAQHSWLLRFHFHSPRLCVPLCSRTGVSARIFINLIPAIFWGTSRLMCFLHPLYSLLCWSYRRPFVAS